MLALRYFPGMNPDFVINGFDGEGIPWDWWVTMCDFIDKCLERGL